MKFRRALSLTVPLTEEEEEITIHTEKTRVTNTPTIQQTNTQAGRKEARQERGMLVEGRAVQESALYSQTSGEEDGETSMHGDR